MTRDASFVLHRSMFVCERTLLISVTLNARSICAGCQPRLLEFKAAVRIVTITTLHRAFKDLVMEGLVKVGLYLIVTAETQLRPPIFTNESGNPGFSAFSGPTKRD